MKGITFCIPCTEPPESVTTLPQLIEYEITESPIYKLKCNKGHTFNIILQHQKFEILYEMACDAFLDGHYQSSVSTFASSLERFYEFFI